MNVQKTLTVALMFISLSISGCLSSSNSSADESFITVTTSEEISCTKLSEGVFYSVNGEVTAHLSYNECTNDSSMMYPTFISKNLKIYDVVTLTIDDDVVCELTINDADILLGGALCRLNIDSRCPEKNWELGYPNIRYVDGNGVPDAEPKLMHTYADGDFWYADYSHCDLSGFDLTDIDFGESNLSYANLSGADLRNSDLSKTDLNNSKGMYLYGCPSKLPDLWTCHVQRNSYVRSDDYRYFLIGPNSNLSGIVIEADFYSDEMNIDLRHRNLSHVNLSGAKMSGGWVPGSDFEFKDIQWNLGNSDLSSSDFSNSVLRLNLSGSDITGVDFSGAILEGDIHEADITTTTFRDASFFGMNGRNLTACSNDHLPYSVNCANTNNQGIVLLARAQNYSGIDLVPGQKFGSVDLSGSDFSYSNVTSTDLRHATLGGTNFYSSNLSDTIFPNLWSPENQGIWAVNLHACPEFHYWVEAYCLNNNLISKYSRSYLANLSDLNLSGVSLISGDEVDQHPDEWGVYPYFRYNFAYVNWENTICSDGSNANNNTDTWGLGISPICSLSNMTIE